MADWITEYFADVDALRLEEYLARHTDDAVVNINDNPPAEGKEQIRQTMESFWGLLGGMRHEILNRYEDGDTVILESNVDYTRKDGQVVTVRTASVLHRDGDLVDRLAFYNDPTPIFA